MNIFEFIIFLTLSTSVAFCFAFRQPDAFRRSFFFGLLGFFAFYLVMLTMATIHKLAGRRADRERVLHRGEGAGALIVSRSLLILAALSLLFSLGTLCAYPIASGIASLIAAPLGMFGCQRDIGG